MMTGKEDLLQSLIEAFLMEKGTKVFYQEAADKATNPEVKKTFRVLSDWEEKHMDYIQFLYQSMNGDQEVESFEAFKERTESPLTEAGIPIKDLESKMDKYIYTDEQAALALALKIEGKASNLYYNLSRSAADTNVQVVFKEMVDQEARHIEYLKQMKAKLTEAHK